MIKVTIYNPPMQGLNMDNADDTAAYDLYLRGQVPQILSWGFDNINNFTEIYVDFVMDDQMALLKSYEPESTVVIQDEQESGVD